MNVRECWIVLSKEMKDALRDRRSLLAGLLFALLGPLVLAVALQGQIESQRENETTPLHVVGAALAPGLVDHLRASALVVAPHAGPPERLLKTSPDAVVLSIPSGAPRELAAGRNARIELWADTSRKSTRQRVQKVEQAVSGYAHQVSEQRLLGMGVTIAAAHPLALELRDMARGGDGAGLVLGMLPVFWLLGVFVGGSHVALDSTGGERERRSLEVLLAQPVSPAALFVGKWLVTSLFGYIAASAGLLLSAFILRRLPVYELGVSFGGDATLLATALAMLFPLALLVGALQCCLALMARSHKEAQTYLNVLQLAPMVLVAGDSAAGWTVAGAMIPLLGHHVQLVDLLAGQPVSLALQAAAAAGSLGAAGCLAWAGARRLANERFVFGL